MAAKDIARPGFKTLGGTQQHLALNRQIGPRGAEKVFRRNGQFRRIAQPDRLIAKAQVKVDPLGQEILDKEGLRLQGASIGIGINLKPPDTARGGTGNRQGKDMPARPAILHQRAGIFDAIGTQQHGGQRQTFHRLGLRIAGKGGGIDGFPGAVGAPVGSQEDINRRRGFAPFHPTVGQVKLGVGHRQEGKVAVALFRHDHRRGRRAGAKRQPGIKADIALRIGLGRTQNLVRLAEEFNRHRLFRRRRAQRADEDMQPVNPAHRGQAKVGHDEPLPCRANLIGVHPRHGRTQGIDAGRLAINRLAHRQAGGQVTVDLLLDAGIAMPDLGADLAAEIVFLIFHHRPAEIAVLRGPQQVAVGHPIQRQLQLFGVHRLNRDRGPRHTRQDIAAPGEAHPGVAVADIGGDLDRFRQNLTIRRRKPLAEGHRIAAAMGQALDAQLPPAVEADREVGCGKLDEGGVIHARLHQILGEIHADAGAGGIGLHLVIGNAKAVFADGVVQRGSGIVAVLQLFRQTQRLHRVAATVGTFQRVGHGHQNRVLLRGAVCPQIGVDGGRVSLLQQATVGAGVHLTRRIQQPGIFGPIRRRIRQVQRCTDKAAGLQKVALGFRLGGGGKMLFGGVAVGDMGIGQIGRLRGDARKLPTADKGQFRRPRRRQRLGLGIAFNHDAGIGALIGLGPARARFRKARSVAGVEGEGGADAVGQAGPLASVQRGVENRGEVAARHVGVFRKHETAVRDQIIGQRRGQCGGQRPEPSNCKHRKKTGRAKTAHLKILRN